jgi:serine protease AprX
MKTSLWGTLIAPVLMALASAAEPAATTAKIEIPFLTRISAPDLKIEKVSAELQGDQVRFTIRYATERERHLSLFDPPRAELIKVLQRGALQPGGTETTLLVPAEKLRQAPEITLRFSADSRTGEDPNFIFLKIADKAARPIFGPRSTSGRGAVATPAGGVLNEVSPRSDIRWMDVSGVPNLTPATIAGVNYNQATRWSERDATISRDILRRGMSPGLGVKALHQAGITGAGVAVGIIDQNMFLDHPEYRDRIAEYHDIGCNAETGSMHGPAVASLLAGKNIGTAPGCRLYFVAAPSWKRDAKVEADALHWLLDRNEALPAEGKIRVVSVSAAPSGDGSPFTQNQALWDAACARAEKAGVVVLDCTAHRGVIGAAYYDSAAPDDVALMQPRFTGNNPALRGRRIMTPMCYRTVAEEYREGECSYQYDGVGGLSWAIPYAAGVLALGWQVNPQLTGEHMLALLRETAHEKNGLRFINPTAFVAAVKQARPRAGQ